MSDAPPVVVLGAGLTGLSAAVHLDGRAQVIERADRPGGHCVTVEESGYRFDRTGHLLHLRDPDIRRWLLELLDEEPLRLERRSRIWSKGVYTRYPFQANTHGLPPDVARDCVLGFLEARDRRRAAGDGAGEPANFEEFVLRYMGRGFAEHFMIPYNTKLWGVPPRELSPAWTERFVPKPTLEEVISGALGCAETPLGYNTEFLYPRRGIGALVEALARRAGPIRTSERPRRIDLHRRRVVLDSGEELPFERLISTIPLDIFVNLVEPKPPQVEEAAGLLRCAPLRYLDVALRRSVKLDYHWIYVPEERYPFYRVGAYTNFSADMAPPGCGSLYVELASREVPELATLVPRVAADLTEMGLIDGPDDIVFARARHLRHAYVLYDHAYREALDVLHPWLREQGICACGRYGRWEYSAMEDALRQGRDAARFALETP